MFVVGQKTMKSAKIFPLKNLDYTVGANEKLQQWALDQRFFNNLARETKLS